MAGDMLSRRRKVIVALVMGVALLATVPRLVWYTSRVIGFAPTYNTDFSKLSQVLPPERAQVQAIYRGLPHQFFAKEELLKDLFLTRNFAVSGYRFYSRPLALSTSEMESLSQLLRSADLYSPYQGPKMCGGLHPDLLVKWKSSNETFSALVCRGCREVVLTHKGMLLQCDTSNEKFNELEVLLTNILKE
ncbi:MAG: hypothetical protein ACK4UN_16050 [Limisphaerales bacterium]